MGVNLKQLEAFVRVADLGSFRRAAERLHTVQPNVSARLAALERALGVTLIERDGGPVRPTAKGRELLGHAREVLRATESLVGAAGADTGAGATLRVGATELVARTWLRSWLRALRTALPELVVEVTVDLAWRLDRELLARSLDLALHNGPFDRETAGEVDLGRFPLAWVAAPAVAASVAPGPGAPSAADLARVPLLVPARDTRPFEQIASHFAARREAGARLVPHNHLGVCRELAEDGAGVANLPAALVADALAAGALVPVRYPWRPDDLAFAARWDAGRAPGHVGAAAALAGEIARESGATDSGR